MHTLKHHLLSLILLKVYQITVHKIQVYDESDESIKSHQVPMLPNKHFKGDDEDKVDDGKQKDLLASFSSTKKWRTDMELG